MRKKIFEFTQAGIAATPLTVRTGVRCELQIVRRGDLPKGIPGKDDSFTGAGLGCSAMRSSQRRAQPSRRFNARVTPNWGI